LKTTLLTSVFERVTNDVLAELLMANLRLFGPNRATARDRRNAKKLGRKPVFQGSDHGEGNEAGAGVIG